MSNWTKEQEDAITKVGSNIIVSAGAGSGKTAVLTERTIRKLINGTSIKNLLILTFTNAAALEMKDRIRKAIKKAGLLEELNYIDSSYITTFDSFALSVVKKYHLLLNISPNISIMDSSIELFKTNEIIDFIFEGKYGDSKFDKLIGDFCTKSDDNIKSVVKELNNKLSSVSNKQEYLNNYVENHYSDLYINGKTDQYIEKVFEIKDEVKNIYKTLSTLVDTKFLTTYNLEPLLKSNTYEEIKANILLVGSPRKNNNCDENYKIYKDKISLLLKKLKDLVRFQSINEMKDSILKTKDYVEEICNVIIEFDSLFLKYKRENNLYTFSDIANMAIKILKDNNDVREELKNSFEEIMIDEYQDTSDIQEEFINLISNNNVYMVGDIKQSIYRFRHANPYIFRNKYAEYSKNNGGIKIDLLKNFRSRSEVLDNINLIFNLIMDSELGDANYKESHQMNFGNKNYLSEKENSQDMNMEIIKYNPNLMEGYDTDEIEAFYIANDIKSKISNNYKVVDKETKKLRSALYSDFAIIMDRGTSFNLYKKIFEYLGVPIIQIKNEKLTLGNDITIISNLINLIVKINNKEYDDKFKYCFVSILRSYLFRLSDEEIFNIITSNSYYETSLFNICKSIEIDNISNIDLINQIVNKFNINEKLITTNNIKESIIRIDYFKNLALSLSSIGYTPITFCKYLNEMVVQNSIEYSINDNNSNSVKILNIHKSKGLEYSICYYSGLGKRINESDVKTKFIVDSAYNIITPYVDNGIKESILKDLLVESYNRENISEKIRLFYVALTRAREKIILLLPIEKEKETYQDLVPIEERLKYSKISDMLGSIVPVLEKYIKEINLEKVNLTKEYESIKNYNYKSEISKSKEIIEKRYNNIPYELIDESRFSKNKIKLISMEEYNNMQEGIRLHHIFETEDFKNTNNPYVLKFLKHINTNYINEFKEYEFIFESDNELKHGFVDLMLEYNDYIDIIDYKMSNVTDSDYVEQLNGYRKYIQSISFKKTNIFLYSILDDKLVKLK